MCFARTRIWACIAKRDLVIWCFEEYLWFVFKVLLKKSYGTFRLDPIELSKIWWFDALKSTFDLSSKCCWRTLMRRLGLIQQSFILYRLQASMKEAWELLRDLPCLKRELPCLTSLSWRKFVSPGILWWFDALKSTFDLSLKCCWRTLMGRLGLIQQSFVLCRLQASMKEAWELLRELPCLKRASLLEELVLKKIWKLDITRRTKFDRVTHSFL